MSDNNKIWSVSGLLVGLVTLLLVIWLTFGGGADPLVQQGVTNFDSMTLSGNLTVAGTSSLQGNLADSGGAFTFADNVMIDGATDAVQLTVQGNGTQTSGLLLLEQSAGTDVLTVSNDGNLLVAGTADIRGNVSDGGGVFTFADNAIIDGAADAVQLTVQGYTTQTTNLLLLEQAAGTDVLTVSNAGNVAAAGTLDVQGGDITLQNDETISNSVNGTIALNGALDVQGGDITLQNDETISNSVNGTIALGGAVDVTGASLQYGPNDLYPLGVGTSGFETVWGGETVTGTLAVTHGLTSPVAAYCILGADPSTGAGAAVSCSATISGATVTIKTWQDDWTAASVGITVFWMVIGTP